VIGSARRSLATASPSRGSALRHQVKAFVIASAVAGACLLAGSVTQRWARRASLTSDELATLAELWLGNLPPPPVDPSNHWASDPRAAALGHRLFFDTRFSANGRVSCATCHKPELGFQDGTGLGVGLGTTRRRTMSVVGAAYAPWLFWDGRKDSLWAQALGPLEEPAEHGGDRWQYAALVARHYRPEYEAVFGPLPALLVAADNGQAGRASGRVRGGGREDAAAVTRVFANVGKAIAAYERLLVPGPARFDGFAASLAGGPASEEPRLAPKEVAGLKLFVGKAGCVRCHGGPLFTDHDFHNTGVSSVSMPPDRGRGEGRARVAVDEFNCRSPFSDSAADACTELRFLLPPGPELEGRFKPPSLRNVAERAPYMHAGQLPTLEAVVDHYDRAPAAPLGKSELRPLGLSPAEKAAIVAFLKTLSGPLAVDAVWLAPPPAG
jgi:cytochrome c peroxidase